MRFVLLIGALLGLVCGLVGCSPPKPKDKVVCDTLVVLADGASHIFKLDPGTYKLDITASGDGASVEWIGAACPGSTETSSLSTVCNLAQTGQLIVENPTVLGTGMSVSVTIKLVRLAHSI